MAVKKKHLKTEESKLKSRKKSFQKRKNSKNKNCIELLVLTCSLN